MSREGNYIEDSNGVIFDVKGLIHPPDRVIAFPRFIPDLKGNRKRKDITYKKIYALSERYRFLEERFPNYLIYDPVFGERLCEVPKENIKKEYYPASRLQELRNDSKPDELESCALEFIDSLKSYSGVSWSKVGISGSLLARLHTPQSDIDPIIYGESNCLRVNESLKSVMQDEKSSTKVYTQDELRRLYSFRSKDTETSFEDFVATEQRKVLQGKFLQHDFFIRCVKNWNEIKERYGDTVYRKVGYAKIKAKISDDSEAIFTPCRYSVDDVRLLEGEDRKTVKEIASFRGRFCEQARKGETVIAQGKVEKVQKKNGDMFFRLLLGGEPSDFMILER